MLARIPPRSSPNTPNITDTNALDRSTLWHKSALEVLLYARRFETGLKVYRILSALNTYNLQRLKTVHYWRTAIRLQIGFPAQTSIADEP